MWIVRLALRRPYTFIVMALLILLISPLAILRTPTDIFPEINIPVISIIWQYTGLAPNEIAERIVDASERGLTTTVNDIEHIESQSTNGIGIIKIFFQPSANIQTALAQVTAVEQSQVKRLPPGTNPPLIILYSASSVPIIQIGLSSTTLSEQQLNDLSQNTIRTQLVTVPGAAIPNPYGGKQRQVTVDLNTAALQAKGLTPIDVVNAINAQNLILPSGTAKIGSFEYQVGLNGSPLSIRELNDLPIRTVNGSMIYIRDVANVRDGFQPQTNIVRQDGVRGTLISILKNGGASTLSVVNGVRRKLSRIEADLPPGIKVTTLFDQSVFVRSVISGVIREALIAACLTAGMVLLFLGSWRSTLIIALSIPLSILSSIIILSALGETINIMTLGGLALAVGILVDDATVTIENIDRHLATGKELNSSILDGSNEITTPAFVSTLCICIVFVPMFFLTGVARYLFVPLAEAVVFAMLASFVLSRTLVPTLLMYLLRGQAHRMHHAGERGVFAALQHAFESGFERLRTAYREALVLCLEHRRLFAPAFLAFCLASIGIVLLLGSDFFPQVDAGVFRLHVRGHPGMRIEETARLSDQVEQEIRRIVPANELQTILDNIGLPYSGINLSYSDSGTAGTSDAEILVSLKQKDHHPTLDYVHKLRQVLPTAFPGVEFFFQPADIISQILNFGLPAPIDVQIEGKNLDANYALAQQIASRMRHVPGAVDVHVHQMMSLPTLQLNIDRTRVQEVGMDARDVAQNLLISLSGSSQTTPAFWMDPKTGITYSVAVQVPQYKMDSLQALMNVPMQAENSTDPQILGNFAMVKPRSSPLVVSRHNIYPVVDVYASVDGRDLGGVAADTNRILDGFQKALPKGSTIAVRGQVETMASSFVGLGVGLAMAIVLVYFLIVVNFQSWLDPFIIITALPGALAGIAWTLLLTRTTLNVPSLTGAVMCMGVATANSILIISFARDRLAAGVPAFQAALEAGYVRIRPVIMTALAMMIGMVPMALGVGEGGEQNAPLGRAVIGGLLFATVATLFFVPVVFSILHRKDHEAVAAGIRQQDAREIQELLSGTANPT